MSIRQYVARKRRASNAGLYAAWAVSGDMTSEQEEEIRSWCAADENNRAELNRIVDTWAGVGSLSKDPDIRAIAEQPVCSHARGARGPRYLPTFAAASIAIVLLLSAVFLQQASRSRPDDMPQKYSTAVGERKTVRLPDGSQLSLNTNSQVIVDFSGGRRRTILDRGEVFFDIAKDSSRPFVVELGARAITVLGTKFNVQRVYNGEVAVAVVEGVVAVHRAEDSASLTAPLVRPSAHADIVPLSAVGQYRIGKGSVITLRELDHEISMVSPPDIEAVENWRRGLVRFDAASLQTVVRELNRYTSRQIIIKDPRAMELEVNAVLDVDRIETALKGLARALPIDVSYHEGHIVIAARDPEG